MRGWVAGGVAVVVLLLSGFGSLVAASPRDLSVNAGLKVAPEAGTAYRVTLDDSGQRATLENGLMLREELPLGFSLPALETASQGSLGGVWWRSSLVGVGDADGQHVLYSLTPRGIQLYADLPAGLAFRPAIPTLPAGTREGASWQGSGVAIAGDRGERPYRFEARAEKADQPGCLKVESTLILGAETIGDSAVWCDGLGQVSGRHGIGVRYQRQRYDAAAAIDNARPAGTTIRGRATGYRFVLGDPAFGFRPAAQPGPTAAQPGLALESKRLIVTQRGQVVRADDTNVAAFETAGGGDELRPAWWAQPGGTILSLAEVQGLIVVTTSQREVVAYETNGRRAWSRRLKDISHGGAVGYEKGELVVVLVSGEVVALRSRSGEVSWRLRTDHPTAVPVQPVGQQLAVLHTDRSVSLIEPGGPDRKPSVRWSEETDGSIIVVLPVGADEVVNISVQGAAQWRTREEGETVREALAYSETFRLAVPGNRTVALVSASGAVILDPQTLAVRAKIPQVTSVQASGTGFWALQGDVLLELTADGTVKREISHGVPGAKSLLMSRSEVWVVAPGGGIACVR